MKAKAILFASVLLVGCQASQDGNVQQHAQSLSTAGQGEAGKLTSRSGFWMDNSSFLDDNQDLWAFISDELKMGIPENDRIREQKQKYLRNKSYLHDVTLRAEPYMYWIAGQVKKRNMPMELVLLPIVESAFNPHATSGANAAGIWQIIPSTGRNYGLEQNRNYDARRDVIASTRAALDMMQRLNDMFDGDWLLTVAAYNSGEGRVMKAIKANKAAGKSSDFWSLTLPQETKLYVPKMLALSDILKNSQRYGVRLPTSDESRALARVPVRNSVELEQIAEMTGISVNKLKTYNAGVKGSTLGADSQQYVMVPRKHAEKLKSSLASSDIKALQPGLLANNRTTSYSVSVTDSASGNASRLNVSKADVQRTDNLPGSRSKPEQNLAASSSKKNATRSARNNGSITYKVRKGDSLSSIAKRHGVNIKDVVRWNTGTANLQPGDQLTLFVKNSTRPES